MTLRGHRITKKDDGEWYYIDTGERTDANWQGRPCGHCDRMATAEGHDACLGTLPGVMNACCGHGVATSAYIQYDDGTCVRGMTALRAMGKEELMGVQDEFEQQAAALGYTYETSWSRVRNNPGWFKHVKRDGFVQQERVTEDEVNKAVRRAQARKAAKDAPW